MAGHDFQVYKHDDGTFRSRLIDHRGKVVQFPVNQLSPELDAEDAQFFRRNVQAALAERFNAIEDAAHEGSASKLRVHKGEVKFFNAAKGFGFTAHADGSETVRTISAEERAGTTDETGGGSKRPRVAVKLSTSRNSSD